jgi:hypothetical protein
VGAPTPGGLRLAVGKTWGGETCGSELVHRLDHLAASVGAFGQNLRAQLAVIVVVLFALLSTRLTSLGTQLGSSGVERRVARTHSGTLGREVGNIPTEAKTFGHLLAVVGTCVGTPFACLSGLEAAVDTPFHLAVEVVDL